MGVCGLAGRVGGDTVEISRCENCCIACVCVGCLSGSIEAGTATEFRLNWVAGWLLR